MLDNSDSERWSEVFGVFSPTSDLWANFVDILKNHHLSGGVLAFCGGLFQRTVRGSWVLILVWYRLCFIDVCPWQCIFGYCPVPVILVPCASVIECVWHGDLKLKCTNQSVNK